MRDITLLQEISAFTHPYKKMYFENPQYTINKNTTYAWPPLS